MGDIEDLMGVSLGFLSVAGGLGVAYYAMWLKSKGREMRHREHMAMIEKGLVPPAVAESAAVGDWKPAKHRRDSGIMMICIGIGLVMLFGLGSGNWRSVWIGGFVAMFGLANLVIALLDDRDRGRSPSGPPQITSSPDR